MSMKEPPLSRRWRPNSSKKLKLVCSFNGQFLTRPPSGKLAYVGGDTRIISVDRAIGFLKLRSMISELCPNVRNFCLKYRLPDSDPLHDDSTNLVLIASDDDVRCMVDECDRVDFYGQQKRLRLFVCSDNGYVNANIPMNCVEYSCNSARGEKGFGFEGKETRAEGVGDSGDHISNVFPIRNFGSHFFGLQFDTKGINDPASDVASGRYSNHSLGEVFLEQQMSKNPALPSSSWCSDKEKYHHPLINLVPEALVPTSNNLNFEHPDGVNSLICRTGHALFPAAQNFEIVAMNTNTMVDGSGPGQSFLWLSMYNGGGMNHGISDIPTEVVQLPQLSSNLNVISESSGSNAKQDFRNIDTMSRTNFNRENIPCPENYDQNNCLLPLSCKNEMMGSAYPVTIHSPSDGAGDIQSGIRNHRFGVCDTRNHRMCLYHMRNQQSNLSEMGSTRSSRSLRLDGRPCSGRCSPGLRPNANIMKQGQCMRPYHPNYLKPSSSTHTHRLQRLMRMMNSTSNSHSSCHDSEYTSENIRDHVTFTSKYGSPNFKEHKFVYHGAYAGSGNLAPLSCSAVEMHGNPATNPYCDGVLANCEPGCNDSKQPFSLNKGAELGCNRELSDGEADIESLKTHYDGDHTLQDRVASPYDLSLGNLSLSSSKVEPLSLSSPVDIDASEVLLNSQSKHLDLIDGHSSPEACKSNVMESSSPAGESASFGNHYEQTEEIQLNSSSDLSIDEKVCIKESRKGSKVIGGSGDLAAFYSLLANRELQTIKNSDLEYIKELGSGNYGTVFYGKWKGSDVAIKKIKPSCFTQDKLEEDRLVADFWKEAYMLGQLHHPNIVAFYGVVTDGPVTNLATITEYMVNGSLKQVLRKKDRTIDHRKRLIIAMDAAFGMEYLHGKNIVHFDLKSHNFLMNMRDPLRPVCKIGDLGLSKIKRRTLVSGGLRGTIPWMAPELFNSKNGLVTEKVDVYSFGIVMWELLTGEEPYGNLTSEEIIGGIIKGNLRPKIPSCDPAWRSLMERCWSSDPSSRPDFSEIAKELRAISAAMNIK